jgi:hypothetical protein
MLAFAALAVLLVAPVAVPSPAAAAPGPTAKPGPCPEHLWEYIQGDTWVCWPTPTAPPPTPAPSIIVNVVDIYDGFAWRVEPGGVEMIEGLGGYAGTIRPVEVTDTRRSPAPWSVSGQMSDATGAGVVPAAAFAWAPRVLAAGAGAVPGPAVNLGAPAVLASAAAAHPPGTTRIGADLTLALPHRTPPGRYGALLTLTALG